MSDTPTILDNFYSLDGDEYDKEIGRLQGLVRDGHYPTVYALFKGAWEESEKPPKDCRRMALEILSCARNPEYFGLVVLLMYRYLYDSREDAELQFEAIAAFSEVPSALTRCLFEDKIKSIAASNSRTASAAQAVLRSWEKG